MQASECHYLQIMKMLLVLYVNNWDVIPIIYKYVTQRHRLFINNTFLD